MRSGPVAELSMILGVLEVSKFSLIVLGGVAQDWLDDRYSFVQTLCPEGMRKGEKLPGKSSESHQPGTPPPPQLREGCDASRSRRRLLSAIELGYSSVIKTLMLGSTADLSM